MCVLEFYMPRPKNHYRTGKYSNELKPKAPHIHTKVPDVDNLSKFILDAMNAVFYDDDSQVVGLMSHKEYCNDVKNKTGYTIVTIVPYEKKADFFKNEHIPKTNGNKSNVLNYIQDSSSSESMSESTFTS